MVQKLQKIFRKLVDIIGDPEFQQADVQDIQWDRINKELATDDEGEWLDQDAGWTWMPISVSVPYQPRRGVPSEPEASPQNYVVGDLYHRKLVSIIWEKLSGSNDFRLFIWSHTSCIGSCQIIPNPFVFRASSTLHPLSLTPIENYRMDPENQDVTFPVS